MNLLQDFKTKPFIEALQSFFTNLNVPINVISELSTNPASIFIDKRYDSNITDIYPFAIVTDAIFNQDEVKITQADIKNDKYEGVLLFGVALDKENPTRSQLADITRMLNREFKNIPVVVIFKYGNQLTFANAERVEYKQEWREGEKVGKISMLKDIDLNKTHAAHERILLDLKNKSATSFDELYQHWQKVLNTKELNKQFFKQIANWYFLSVAKSKFPFEYLKNDSKNNTKTNDELQSIANQKASIRFITRMIFVWFLKEKGLISNDLFDASKISKILKKDAKKQASNYYNAILQNLFFATLNKASEHREFALNKSFQENKSTYDVNSLYRYESMFQDENPENIMKIFEQIPFLNGGLFDSLDNKESNEIIDGFSRNPKWQATMPDFLFFEEDELDFNEQLNKTYETKNKKYNVKGLFAIFNEYKFTIEENTPTETDVALDPYLLGEIFENLLAYYNPETGTTARKGSGSFYTPQEIVNYMVDESLKAYLETKLGNDSQILQGFQNLGGLNIDQKTKIVQALADVKILDPACGSGAFPMGVLYKMVDMLKNIDPDNSIWKQIQHDKIIGEKIAELEADKKAIQGLSDKQVREKATAAVDDRLKNLEEIFNNEYNFDDYARKLYIIQNCIYGVDIQDVAIQISKLRFFLSLIVDQKNEDIKPLPNLETKFVIANTLIGIDLPKLQLLGEDDHSEDATKALKEELKNVREQHFKATDRKSKLAIKAKDKTIREQIANSLADSFNTFTGSDIAIQNKELAKQQLSLAEANEMPDMVQEIVVKDLFGGESLSKVNYRKERIKECNAQIKIIETKIASYQTNTFAEQIRTQALKIAEWDIYNQNASADWFDMDWMFGITDGFDVVIGNPPYAGLRTGLIDSKIIDYSKINYILAEGQFDYYSLFLEKGSMLLNNFGHLSFIIPKTITSNQNFEVARNFILNNIYLIKYIDTKMPFENAVVESNIIICSKTNTKSFFENLIYQNESFVNVGEIIYSDVNNLPFHILPINLLHGEYSIISKINLNKINILADFVNIIRGFEFGFNHSSISINKTKYKVIKGESVNRYTVDFKDKYVNADFKDSKTFKKEEYFLKTPKLLTRFVSNSLIFSLDEEGYCNTNVVYNIHLINDNTELKFLLSILNSKTLNFWFFKIFMNDDVVFPHIQKNQLELIPIKIPTDQQPFITLVDQILSAKKQGQDTSALEHQIDVMVYHLYELSYDEACVIDSGLSLEDFERYKL